MSKYDLEQRIITSIIRERDVRPFIRARISKNYFKSTSSRIAYSWIRAYYDKYNSVPSLALFREQYPNYDIARSESDPPQFLVNALLDRQSFKILVDGIADAGQELQSNNPRKALTKLTQILEKARLVTDRSFDLAIKDDIKDALERYRIRKNSPLLTGMPYGFAPLDESTDGMLPGQLGVVFGISGVGKSWLACIIGYRAFLAGYKVLHITKENADIEISSRITALHCHVSPFRLRTGQLTGWEEKKLGRLAKRLLTIGDRYIISSQDEVDGADSGSEAVRQKILQYRPDLCIVDGVYLLNDDDLTGPEWQTLRKMAYRLKSIARKENVHVLGITQAASGGDENTPELAFSKGIVTAADNLLYIYKNDELESMGCRGINLIKQREGPQIDFRTTWDFDGSHFAAVDIDNNEEPDEQAEIPV